MCQVRQGKAQEARTEAFYVLDSKYYCDSKVQMEKWLHDREGLSLAEINAMKDFEKSFDFNDESNIDIDYISYLKHLHLSSGEVHAPKIGRDGKSNNDASTIHNHNGAKQVDKDSLYNLQNPQFADGDLHVLKRQRFVKKYNLANCDDDDVDPNYKILLERVKKVGKLYVVEFLKRNGVPTLLKYEDDERDGNGELMSQRERRKEGNRRDNKVLEGDQGRSNLGNLDESRNIREMVGKQSVHVKDVRLASAMERKQKVIKKQSEAMEDVRGKPVLGRQQSVAKDLARSASRLHRKESVVKEDLRSASKTERQRSVAKKDLGSASRNERKSSAAKQDLRSGADMNRKQFIAEEDVKSEHVELSSRKNYRKLRAGDNNHVIGNTQETEVGHGSGQKAQRGVSKKPREVIGNEKEKSEKDPRNLVDETYHEFINALNLQNDQLVFSYGNEKVTYETNVTESSDSESDSDSDVQILDTVGFNSGKEYTTMVSSKNSGDTDNQQYFAEISSDPDVCEIDIAEINGRQECNPLRSSIDANETFRKKLMSTLKKPFDQEEYKKLRKDISVRGKLQRHKELRGGRERRLTTDIDGKSYLDHFPEVQTRLEEAQSDPRKKLNILRGFFFYLKNLTNEGAFFPWRDQACLKVMPGSRKK